MTYYQFPYQVLSWKPPDLSPAEQFAFGQRVASVGKRQMRDAFRRALPKEGSEHAGEIAAFRKLTIRRRVIRSAIVFVPLLAVFYFVPRFLAAALSIAAFVCLIWYGSIAFAMLRYSRFLSRCLARYETAIRSGYVLLACP